MIANNFDVTEWKNTAFVSIEINTIYRDISIPSWKS